ncbi:MAG: OmpA family protein [Flavobacterium sp.]|uniref:OmpA family protein n=1 Tax=Flavobacterium sp. TaxID=239 RepID=UPI003BEC4F62
MNLKCFFIVLLFTIQSYGQEKQFIVFFDFNKDVPNESSQNKIVMLVLENKNIEITRVFGYCDSVDDSKYNKDLAMRRVNSVMSFFKSNAVRINDKVELKSFGKDFKYSKNQSDNRKVEVFYNLVKDNQAKIETTKTLPKTPFSNKSDKQLVKQVTTENKENDILEVEDLEVLVEKEKATLASKFDKAKVGDLVRISNINFYFNSEKVMEQSFPILDELFDIMLNDPTLTIEIHGHICCNPNPNDTKLSYRRALVILKYLTKRGIAVNRLAFKGYGSNDPIYKVPERNEKERAANRRVEILIVAKR